MLAQIVQLAADTDLENSESVFELSPLAVTVVTGALIPLITALVTKISASALLKGILTLTLSVAAGVFAQATTDGGGAIFSDETLILAGVAWVEAVASYLGLWRNANVNAKLAPTKGIG